MSFEILRLTDIQKYYGTRLILDNVTMNLNQGERVALVGENGVGKTTLMRIINGVETYDAGVIDLREDATIGYLPQTVTGGDGVTVQAYIESATGDLDQLRARLRQLEQAMANTSDNAGILAEYSEIQARFEARGGYDLTFKIEQIFEGLNIAHIDTARALHTLSGGERTRIALTALLLRQPDLLLLDEPTNHLDFAGIEWLERYLADYAHALLLITHDRTFINRVATVITELQPVTHRLHTYHGNYEDYLAQREREYQQQVDAYNQQTATLKTLQRTITTQTHNTRGKIPASVEGDKHIRFAKNMQSDKTKRRLITDARGRLEALEAERLTNPRHEWRVEFRFDPLPLPSAEPLRLQGISKSFGDVRVFDNVNAVVKNGERVVLVAPNGTGKSTLLRIIMGLQTSDAGTVTCSPSVRIGYLDQDGETLDPAQTVLACYREVTQGTDHELLAELHRTGLFSDASLLHKTVADLSVGQRRKLGLARLIASRANMLLLDEPTNHLDPLSLEALEQALIGFEGTLLAVSHDRRFVEKVATRIWYIEQHQLAENSVTQQ
ncbi:MAG: ribosomal protection-like ABC-F family protein [Anaerolineae bacterium]